jgi:hypothetical protein
MHAIIGCVVDLVVELALPLVLCLVAELLRLVIGGVDSVHLYVAVLGVVSSQLRLLFLGLLGR